jgi:hypothetical protein
MNTCSNAIGVFAMLFAGTAPMSSAAHVISELQGQGYEVRLNGQPNGALGHCTVTGVHQTAKGQDQFGTAYVDLDCPGDD